MAKGKSQNPADAFRKAQRKKELKKNKAERAKARDFSLVKKDTRDIEEEIEKLSSNPALATSDKQKLKELQTELEKINQKKEEYVAEHPEHRKLVFRQRKKAGNKEDDGEGDKGPPVDKTRKLFDKNGIPIHPERSIYYDPVMNPFGVPPPGMPYIERPLRPDEMEQPEEEEGSDDDIAMPDGPPPDLKEEEEEDSDDDIPMPEGPPPPKPGDPTPPPPLPFTQPPFPPSFPMLPPSGQFMPPFPPTMSPTTFSPNSIPPPPSGLPPLPAGFPQPPPPNSAPQIQAASPAPPPGLPPLPPGFPQPPANGFVPPPPMSSPPSGSLPPPPPFAQPPFPPGPPHNFSTSSLPPPPPGFFPRRHQSNASMQDPLSSVPHQTFQAHRAAHSAAPPLPPQHLPQRPGTSNLPLPASGNTSSSATITAEPQLRDLKKESTAFVPSSLAKRKKNQAGNANAKGATGKINAAPSTGEDDGVDSLGGVGPGGGVGPKKPDLMSALKGQLGLSAPSQGSGSSKAADVKPKGDYEKFVEEMGDILG